LIPTVRKSDPENQSLKDFFISYTKIDTTWAEWIAWQLEDAGFSVVLQVWDFKAGCNFILEMNKAIKETRRTIAIYSPEFFQSLMTQSEWAATLIRDPAGTDEQLIPVRVRECKPDGLLAPIRYIDLINLDEGTARKTLLAEITRTRMKPSSPPQYPGHRSIPVPPRFPKSMPEIWNIPHLRNPNFTGRDTLLNNLHDRLRTGNCAAVTQAISGLGGIGKTQLAAEYAYRNSADYNLVWWLHAEDPATLATDYAELADHLNLPRNDTSDQREIIRAVRTWLEHNNGWLLIFDNAQQPEDLHDPKTAERQYLPSSSTGHIIITSRNPNWGGLAHSLPIRVFERSESIRFLLNRTGQPGELAVDALSGQLGDLPLALEQAGAYISETPGISIQAYLDLFKTRHTELLERGNRPVDYLDTINTTWNISMDKVRMENAVAADLLNLFSFFAPDNIPPSILGHRDEYLPKTMKSLINDKINLNEALNLLQRYSLVESSGDNISIHRLVQLVTRDRLKTTERKRWCKAAVKIITDAFNYRSDSVQSWHECAPLLSHAQFVAGYAEALDVEPDGTSKLLTNIGYYFLDRAELQNAKQCFEQALAINEKSYGPEHRSVAFSANNLGLVLRRLGDFSGAKQNYERALAINEKVSEPDYLQIATNVNNIGLVLRILGDLQGAKQNHERALAVFEESYGPEHPNVAMIFNNIGLVLMELGDFQGAKQNYERALAISEKSYGPEHPAVANSVNNIGGVLIELGDLQGAKQNYERALAIDEKVFGPNHPDVAREYHNIGSVLRELGDLQGAKQNYERALSITENVFGPNHLRVATIVGNLGGVLRDLGDLQGAKQNFERALAIDEMVFGPEHLNVATGANNLGCVLKRAGDFQGAKQNYERALDIFGKNLGQHHKSTMLVRNNLLHLYD
jgi:tetratricopeptide (TPR) repeat protein